MIFKADAKELIQRNKLAQSKATFPHVPKQGITRTIVTYQLPKGVELYTTKKGSNVKVNHISIIDPPHIPEVGMWWRWNVSYVTKVKRVEQYFVKNEYHICVYAGKPKKLFKPL